MKALTKAWFIAALVALCLGSFGFKADASLIDLGQVDLTAWIAGVPAAQQVIERTQGLPRGSLVYLNSFRADTGTLGDNGAADASHFGVTLSDGGVNGNVTWDLATAGFQLSYVFLIDPRDSTSPSLYHLYGVTPDEAYNSNGDHFVTINGISNIAHIGFFGVAGSPVPDGGSTSILLGLGLGTIEFLRRLRLRRCDTTSVP